MSKTLVTGAAGFLGNHVVRQLLNQGREVRALVRPGEDTRSLEGLEVERIEGDLRDPEAVQRAVAGCPRVFHLAAIYALWLPEPRLMYDVNVDGTRNVMWACWKAEVERVVHTSSIAALGLEPGDGLATEQTAFNQVEKANDYVFSKYLSEQVVLGFAREGLPVVVVNPSFPFGVRDVAPTPTGQMLLDIVQGRYPGYFDAGFNAVDAEDVARGHLLAESKGRVGERYLLSNQNLTMRDFMTLAAREAGVKVRLRKVPLTLGLALGNLMDRRAVKTGQAPRISGKALRYAAQALYYDNTKAREELGLEFTPIEESIRKALTWFRQQDYLR